MATMNLVTSPLFKRHHAQHPWSRCISQLLRSAVWLILHPGMCGVVDLIEVFRDFRRGITTRFITSCTIICSLSAAGRVSRNRLPMFCLGRWVALSRSVQGSLLVLQVGWIPLGPRTLATRMMILDRTGAILLRVIIPQTNLEITAGPVPSPTAELNMECARARRAQRYCDRHTSCSEKPKASARHWSSW